MQRRLSRRKLLKAGLLGAVTVSIPVAAPARQWMFNLTDFGYPSVPARTLFFYNLHTGETLRTIYFEHGEYLTDALLEINRFFRDFRTNEVKAIDRRLLDLLWRIYAALDTTHPFNLISGYRSPATNEWLANHTEGVSHHSLHTYGMASDVNVQGCPLESLRAVALAMRGGGVGFYPRSGFVHIDCGRVRYWSPQLPPGNGLKHG
jgi:uncharacterized protein YcbK (DUF882 family)